MCQQQNTLEDESKHTIYGLIESGTWILSARSLKIKLLKHFLSKLQKQLNQINSEQ